MAKDAIIISRLNVHPMKTAVWHTVILGFSALVLAALAVHGSMGPLGDFANYYFGAQFLVDGQFGAWIYDPGAFNTAVRAAGAENVYVNYTPVPPITAILYVPFASLPIHFSKLLFNVLGAGLYLIMCVWMIKRLQLDVRWMLVCLLPFLMVLKSNMDQGQTYLFIIVMLIEGFHQRAAGRPWGSALLWSLAIVLKVFPAVILLFLFIERDWKQVGRVCAFAAFWGLVSIPWVSWDVWHGYAFEILPRLMHGEINDPFSPLYQSVSVVLRTLLVPDAVLNPGPFWQAPKELFYVLEAAFKFTLVYVVWKTARRLTSSFARFAWILFAGILLTGYGTTYGLMFALPLMLVLSKEPVPRRWVLIGLLSAAMLVSLANVLSLPGALQFPRLVMLLVLTIALLVFWKPRFHWKEAGLVLMLAVGWGWHSVPKESSSRLLLPGVSHLLALDYQVEDHALQISFWTGGGAETMEVSYPVHSADSLSVNVHNGQLWYGDSLLTHTSARKKKPVLINGHQVLYLSDYGRGVGFYALRQLTLIPEPVSPRQE